MAKTIKEMIEIMEWFDKGGEVECVDRGYDDWGTASHPCWNWDDYDYRIKKFQYPMWFKSTLSSLVVRFDNLNSGEVVIEGQGCKLGEYKSSWYNHTNKGHWVEIEEPKTKQTTVIKKWLIEENNIQFVVETSDIDSWLKSFPTAKKLKLIESYEVEI